MHSLLARGTCFCLLLCAAVSCEPAAAQERVFAAPRPTAPLPGEVTFYGYPPATFPWMPALTVWSPDAAVRERQAIARQLQVLDYARWTSLRPAAGLWPEGAFYDPTFIWGYPFLDAVAQPIGHGRVYDGRGGYSYGPIYAAPAPPAPAPLPPPEVPLPPQVAPPQEEDAPVIGRGVPLRRERFSW